MLLLSIFDQYLGYLFGGSRGRHITYTVAVCALAAASALTPVAAQSRSSSVAEVRLSDGRTVQVRRDALQGFAPPPIMAVVARLTNTVGIRPTFRVVPVEPTTTDNAAAGVIGVERVILFSPTMFASLARSGGVPSTRAEWAALSILAHEIGHHIQGHTLSQQGSTPEHELEADEWAGFALAKLGATLPDAQAAIQALAFDGETLTHPGKARRLDAVATGWRTAGATAGPANNSPVLAPTASEKSLPSGQNEEWLAVTRKALDASNAHQLDTAELYARRSLRMSTTSPYAYYVLANVANERNQKAAAVGQWKMVIETSGSDTSYREIKNNSQYYLAMAQFELAKSATNGEQKMLAKEASASLKTLLSIQPDGADASSILGSLADAIKLSGEGDGSSAYTELLANPRGYNDVTLTMAGVIASSANKSDDAITLFEAATKKNSNSRDALQNLAAVYYGKNQFQKMFEPTNKLVALDPNNYDAWMLYAYAAQGLAKGTSAPAEKKAWTDTLTKYYAKAEALPVRVQITEFQRGASNNASLSLRLEQVAGAGGSYTVTVDFLGASGNVISTVKQSVGALVKGETKSVTVKASGVGIQAYRYRPLN